MTPLDIPTAAGLGAVVPPAAASRVPAELVAAARDRLAGRLPLDPVPVPDALARWLDQFDLPAGPPADPFELSVRERMTLQALLGGQIVVCTRAADGTLAVLCSGLAAVEAVLPQLTEAEFARVWVEHPDRVWPAFPTVTD